LGVEPYEQVYVSVASLVVFDAMLPFRSQVKLWLKLSVGREKRRRRFSAMGKLTIPPDFRIALSQQSFFFLDITVEHAHVVGTLPAHHRDPFDRMLIPQAQVERLTIITRDGTFRLYDVPTIEVSTTPQHAAGFVDRRFERRPHAGG
jgi:hypothetical protein